MREPAEDAELPPQALRVQIASVTDESSARDIAERFNSRFGETFRLPEGRYPEVGARIMDLQEPERKMSTTLGTPQGTLSLLDPPEVLEKKVRSAVTDSASMASGSVRAGSSHAIEPTMAISTKLRIEP